MPSHPDHTTPTGGYLEHWQLQPDIAFLNHGSFGACPRKVLAHQQTLRDRLERQPVQFYVRDLEPMLDQAREALASFLGATPTALAFVRNATGGINAVLRSLQIKPGDELLTTNHEYNACSNALHFVARRAGAKVVVVDIPLEVTGPAQIVELVMQAVTPRTRLALLDHITSQTAMIMPIATLVAELDARGVDTLVDGAHAPGMLPLALDELGAAYYTGNCHKWLCAPKGAGFLYVREDKQPDVRPIAISHGANSPRTSRSRFLIEFDWVGTDDYSAALCVPVALEFMEALLPGGWPALREHNRQLVLDGRKALADALQCSLPCPEHMIGSLASVRLPPGSSEPSESPLYADPLQTRLLQHYAIEVPVVPWPAPPHRLIRISAQLYNRAEQYTALASALRDIF